MVATEWRLVRFKELSNLRLWNAFGQPCERVLRARVSQGLIPHYQLSGTLFFQAEEVRRCIFDGTLVEVAA
jgi:hypothetical protein